MDNIVVRDEKGKVVGHYVRVNFLINEQNVRTNGITYNLSTTYSEPVVADNQNWIDEHKCLNNININALNTKKENNNENQNLENPQDTNNSFPKQKDNNTHKKTSELDFIKNSDDIRDIFNDDEIAQHKIQLKIILKMVEL
jgi:hypothetical protein